MRQHHKVAGELWIGDSGKVMPGVFRYMSLSISLLLLPLRVNRAFVARMDLQAKEDSKVEWDYRGHKEMQDLKDNP